MNATNSGAVFFLGTRAHYQVLTPPESHCYDVENGNESKETIYQNPSTVQDNLWSSTNKVNGANYLYDDNTASAIDISEKFKQSDYGDGVKQRWKKNRKQDGSNELILNDNEETINPSVLNNVDSDSGKNKAKRGRVSVSYLLAVLSRRRRPAERPLPVLPDPRFVCTFRDSCRCDDCQSRYFECDESDDDYSISDDSEYSPHYSEYSHQLDKPQQVTEYPAESEEYLPKHADEATETISPEQIDEGPDGDDDGEDADDGVEVFIDTPPADSASTEQLIEPAPARAPNPVIAEDEEMMVELAAGAPVFFDHLLNHPITCAIQ